MSPNHAKEIQIAAITHKGRVRERNEDAVAVLGTMLTGTMHEPVVYAATAKPFVLLIADGMGGHAKGDVASQTALKVMMDSELMDLSPSQWVETLHAVNHRLYDLMSEEPQSAGLGTTVVGVSINGDGLTAFNVGDSRAYRHGHRGLVRLSEDDVPLKAKEQRSPRLSHQITQSLGGRLVRTAIAPHIVEAPPLDEGESLLLCSDGLTDMLEEHEIANVLSFAGEPIQCVARLLALALDAGGHDNISIIVARA